MDPQFRRSVVRQWPLAAVTSTIPQESESSDPELAKKHIFSGQSSKMLAQKHNLSLWWSGEEKFLRFFGVPPKRAYKQRKKPEKQPLLKHPPFWHKLAGKKWENTRKMGAAGAAVETVVTPQGPKSLH